MPQSAFQSYFDDVIKSAGFSDAPEDFKQAYRERLEIMFAKRLGVDCLSMLDAEAMAEFKELSEKNPNTTPQQIFEFFQSHVPDLETKIVDIMKEFAEEFVKAAKAVAI